MSQPPFRPSYLLQNDPLIRHSVRELGVSEDIAYMLPEAFLTTMPLALAERHFGLVFWPDRELIVQHHHELRRRGELPVHLQPLGAYVARHIRLFGRTPQESMECEIKNSIEANRNTPPEALQQSYEDTAAKRYANWLKPMYGHLALQHQLGRGVVTIARCHLAPSRHCINTGDSLHVTLPKKHGGIVHVAPMMNDAFMRAAEIAHNNYAKVALLNTTTFSAVLHRQIAHHITKKDSPATAWIRQEAISQSAPQLVEQVAATVRPTRRFGAMILSTVHHLQMEEIQAAIATAPDLLAPGGILLLSDLESFPNQTGSIWQMIHHARTVFGKEPEKLGVMTEEGGDQEGRQAIFIKD